jgi:signal transduction histidine kinase
MTPGTSPRPLQNPFTRWTAAAKGIREALGVLVRLPALLRQLRLEGPELARAAAVLYLASLAVVLTTAWHAPSGAAGDAIAGFPAWHLAFLMATGAAAALLTLAGPESADTAAQAGEPNAASGVSELMAQMSHELRTPLNAVIGFSDVMLHELHGPLGNARYQEYAHHISESGGRLLKSSEQALAVTEAMTALMADRRRSKRERLVAAALLRDAWREAAPASGNTRLRLALTTCTTCDILCERRPTVQALEHLFREAQGHMPGGGTVEVTGKRRGGRRSLAIEVRRASDPSPAVGGRPLPITASEKHRAGREGSDPFDRRKGSDPTATDPIPEPHARLRIILARLLLEVQGATLTCTMGEDGCWAARIEFPGRG